MSVLFQGRRDLKVFHGNAIMVFIAWNRENHAVGFKVIDEQHQELFDIINALYVVNTSKAEKTLSEIFESLIFYCQYHFNIEETAFMKFGYTSTDEHLERHRIFVDRIFELNGNLENSRMNVRNDLLVFLKEWILQHIMKEDFRYADFFRARDINPFPETKDLDLSFIPLENTPQKVDVSVGIEQIDRQHFELLSILREISTGRFKDEKAQIIGSVLMRLKYYTQYHFSSEEILMKKTGFPLISAQKEKHQLFTKKVDNYLSKFREKRLNLTEDVTRFLYHWTVEHIMEEDRKFGEFFKGLQKVASD